MTVSLGTVGAWQKGEALKADMAAELEDLGYGAIWIGRSPGEDLALAESLLDATSTIAVATGVVNIWRSDAVAVASSYRRLAERHASRFLLGVGVGHPERSSEYRRPFDVLVAYLDELDRAGVSVESRALAALGPRVLRLSAERSAGAHPYLTTPAHTRFAREVLGPGPLLAPEHKVIVSTAGPEARSVARQSVGPYLRLKNYRNNLLRTGYSEADLDDGGNDKLIDDLVLRGDARTVASGLRSHLEAGADHVCIQVLDQDPMSAYRALAAELL